MANKSDSEFSKAKGIRGLDEALQRSFTNIKNDMTALREGMHQQGVKLAEVKQDLKDSKSDLVTVDKFNILKIKIGELNENMKKVWDIEKKLEDLDRKAVSASEFDKHSVAVDNEIAKLREDVKDLNEAATTEEQTKNLVEDINSEFDNIKKALEDLRSIKDTITKTELDKRTEALNKKAADVRKDFDKVKAEVKSKVTASQVEDLVSDINKEFDRIKGMIADVKEGEKRFALDADVEKQISKIEKKVDQALQNTTAAIEEFSKGVEVAFKEFAKTNEKKHDALSKETSKLDDKLSKKMDSMEDALSGDITAVKKEMKGLVTKKQAENLVGDINKEFDRVKDDADASSKAIVLLKKESATRKELTAEAAKLKKGIDALKKDLAELRKEAATEEEVRGLFEDMKASLTDFAKSVKKKFDDLTKMVKSESDDAQSSIKSNSQDINALEKGVKKELKQRVTEDDLHDELDVIRGEFEKLHKELKDVRNRMLEDADLRDVTKRLSAHVAETKKEYVNAKRFNKLVDAVEGMQDELEKQKELIVYKNKELRAYAKELRAAKKSEKRLARYESVVAKSDSKAKKSVKAGKAKPSVPYRKSAFLGNFLIGAAFVLLVVAIGFFISGMTGITDSMAIAAVVCFVLGIIIRVIVGLKRNGN